MLTFSFCVEWQVFWCSDKHITISNETVLYIQPLLQQNQCQENWYYFMLSFAPNNWWNPRLPLSESCLWMEFYFLCPKTVCLTIGFQDCHHRRVYVENSLYYIDPSCMHCCCVWDCIALYSVHSTLCITAVAVFGCNVLLFTVLMLAHNSDIKYHPFILCVLLSVMVNHPA